MALTDEQLHQELYCDWCEVEGHSFRTCPRRDDEGYEDEA